MAKTPKPPEKVPFTFIVTKPNGRVYWRFRRAGITGALPGAPGEEGFWKRYGELRALSEKAPREVDRTSIEWLVKRYRYSAEFKSLRPRTQGDYDDTLDLIVRELGDQPYRLVTFRMVKAVRDDYAKTPRKAHKIKQMVSRLYSWAAEEGLVDPESNPARHLRRLKARSTPITPWSESEITLFQANCPDWLLPAFMLALFTGQRREDLIAMQWQDFQGSFIRVRQSKTGEPLDVACHPTLRDLLKARRNRFGGQIVRNANGRPMTANALSQAIRRVAMETEGMPKNRSLHGLRYAAAGRGDEAGWSVTEAIAVLGHRTYAMAVHYMAQRRNSEAAMRKLEAGNAP